METNRLPIQRMITAWFLCLFAVGPFISSPVVAGWPNMIFPSAAGITLAKGKTYTIQWEHVIVDPVDILLCEDLPDETFCFYSIAGPVSNSGSYSWTVPSDLPNGSNYVISVGVPGVSLAGSDNAFTISNSSASSPNPVAQPMPPTAPSGVGIESIGVVNGLWAINEELNGEPGRGFQIELRQKRVVMTFYGYNKNGAPVWWLTSGRFQPGAKQIVMDLHRFEGGMAFGDPVRSAYDAGPVGKVVVRFNTPKRGVICLPGEECKPISKLEF
ncbi:GPI anchored serine-threonine rich family protein [Crocinitomicaceae bacterium]|nr:GPI anchored serine-threonine rich family protein [Crocinitomicaceae bacterium]